MGDKWLENYCTSAVRLIFVDLLLTVSFLLFPSPAGLSATPAVMIQIAQCESGQQQFSNGSLVRDSVTGDHVGVYQISMKLFYKQALSMGWDITTEAGNIAFALYLYHLKGTNPWYASKDCWSQPTPSTLLLAYGGG